MIALIKPVLGLVNKDIDLRNFHFSESFVMDKKEIQEKSEVLTGKQMKQTAEVYRNKIIRQIEDCVKGVDGIYEVKADVIINEDYKSEKFGDIKRVYLSIKPDEVKDKVQPVQKVEKIVVGKNSSNTDDKKTNGAEDEGKTAKPIDSNMKKEIEDMIVKTLGVQKDNIVMSLQD
jgi:stage III sporulation protein AF